jgi:tetratricopeptide (TPR) repeat protein
VDVPLSSGPDLGASLFERGQGQYNAGLLQAATASYRAALEHLDVENRDHDLIRWAAYRNLGVIATFTGDPREAKSCFIRSLEAAEPTGLADTQRVDVLLQLAVAEHELAFRQGPLWLGPGFVNEPTAKHLREATEHLDQAREILRALLPRSTPGYVISLVESARLARAREDLDAALGFSLEAVEAISWGPLPQHVAWSATREHVLAGLLAGQPSRGLSLVRTALSQTPELEPSAELAECLDGAMRAATLVDDLSLRDELARVLLKVDWTLLAVRLAGRSERQARHLFEPHRRRAESMLGAYLFPLLEAAAGHGYAETEVPGWLYEISLNRKGLLAERQGRAWLTARPDESRAAGVLRARRRLAAIDLGDTEESTIKGARRRHDEAARELDEAEAAFFEALAIDSAAPSYVRCDDVLAALGPEQLLVDVVVVRPPDGGEPRYGAFLVRPGHPVLFRDLGATAAMNETLDAVLNELARRPAADHPQAQRVAELTRTLGFLTPADDAPYHLVVAPTARWNSAPFLVLPDAHGQPLIDHHLVSLVPSARWLVQPVSPPATGPAMVIGDPDFDLDVEEHKNFSMKLRPDRLKHSRAEARAVADILDVAPVMDEAATRAALLGCVRPQALHVASHGMFIDKISSLAELKEPTSEVMRSVHGIVVTEETSPTWSYQAPPAGGEAAQEIVHRNRVRWLMEVGPSSQATRSVLLLAGFNAWVAGVQTPEAIGVGAVSAAEFALLDLAGTQIVVLSACQTGTGAVDYADGGHIGLRSAALNAGARSAVSPLWEVLDSTTADLMTRFSRQIFVEGQARGEALRAAVLGMRERQPQPFYWAGWTIEGDTGQLHG